MGRKLLTFGKEKTFYFSKGNRKLNKNILTWNLPRLKTCPFAGKCKNYCYEIKIERMYKNVLPCRERNFKFSKSSRFVKEIVAYLKKRKETIVRIHASGDLYSYEYFKKWRSIAEQCPEKVFYCYTKSFGLFNVFEKLPSNFIMIQSYDSKDDTKINPENNTARVICNPNQLKSNEFLCPYEKWKKTRNPKYQCGHGCKYCMDKKNDGKIHVAFLIH